MCPRNAVLEIVAALFIELTSSWKIFDLIVRTLQPILCEPVEKVLTYEALRSASADVQTQAHHTPQLK